jgi:MFS family permease
MSAVGVEARPNAMAGFLARFVSLTLLAGTTIGMGNVITTLFALHLGATPFQIGLISGAATLGMLIVTLPAGFLIARFGARRVYLLASLNCLIVYMIVPWLTLWSALAVARSLVGLSVPFRTVSMNSTFLQRMRELGAGKAGWYRAAQTTGTAVIGPWLGTFLTGSSSFLLSYACLAGLFGLMALWSQSFLPEAETVSETVVANKGGFLGQIRLMLKDLWVGESCLTEFVNSSTTSLFSSFMIVLAVKELGFRTSEAVTLVTSQGIGLIVALFLFGPLLRRVRIGYAYVASLLSATASLLLVGMGHTLPVLMLGTLLLAWSAALIHLVNMLRLAGSPIAKSKISGLLNLASQGGSLLGSVAGGALSLVVGLQHVFLAWIPIIWVTAALCLWRVRATREAAI